MSDENPNPDVPPQENPAPPSPRHNSAHALLRLWPYVVAVAVLCLGLGAYFGWRHRQELRALDAAQLAAWKKTGSLPPSGGRPFPKRVEIPVPQLYQWDERWAEDLLGPTQATIAAEGCALTSAAMVLNFYGVDTDPKRLNAYLNDHEGFTPEGWIWWEKAADFPPATVHKAYEDAASYYLIDTNLEKGNPVIVKLKLAHTNHFVVIAGKEGLDYLIRDPGHGGTKGLYPLKELGSNIEGLRYYERIP